MEAFVGEIRGFAFNYPPEGWIECNGQSLSMMSYQALYSILGSRYGQESGSTFSLPLLNLVSPNHFGKAIIGAGQGPGLTGYSIGSPVGQSAVTLTYGQIPAHNHTVTTTVSANLSALSDMPDNTMHLSRTNDQYDFYTAPAINPNVQMSHLIGSSGGSQPHNNYQPYTMLLFCICNDGVYPVRGE